MAVNATAVWRVRPSGSNTNGGGYDPGISGAATDYSRQNSAQATGTHGSAVSTTTFTDLTAANFTSAMVGNCINIAGQGFYFIVTFTDASHVVVDRALGTFTLASWSLGGGWATPDANTTSSGPTVAGNTVYVLGSATPNPSSYVYDYTITAQWALVQGVNVANDPSTPGYKAPPDTTGGMPTIKLNASAQPVVKILASIVSGIWFTGNGLATGDYMVAGTSGSRLNLSLLFGCVLDQFGVDSLSVVFSVGMIGSEIFSSVSGTAGSVNAAFYCDTPGVVVLGCNIHDCVSSGVIPGAQSITVSNSIISKCGADGILCSAAGSLIGVNNTIDGNVGNGVNVASGSVVVTFINNIVSNHTGVGKFGFKGGGAVLIMTADYNVYYNNTSNYNGISAGPHDTALGSTPYVASATENYTLS